MRRTLMWPLLVGILCLALVPAALAQKGPISKQTQECVGCHSSMPGIVSQWQESAHYTAGVGCYECHQAQKGEPDAMSHYGFTVAVIVSPKDCSRCHPKEVDQFTHSHHAQAGDILNSQDGLLGQTVGGAPAVVVGCRQCHGSLVKVQADGTPDPTTWPNTGIGRVNPDGSKGSCTACHTRHRFSIEQARQPEACGKCHLGPDHPQKEIYEESKHGILYRAFKDKLNMGRKQWVAGRDYTDAPTCASCHMGATPDQGVTHDVGSRLSWNLRAPISIRTADSAKKLADMKEVCSSCHAASFVNGFYQQFDNAVALYNDKFGRPAKEIRELLIKDKILDSQNFNDKLDWTYFELWHHEGRRARHGAAMSGPDYAWWHGFYDLAKAFYSEYLPEVKEACDQAGKPEVYRQIIKTYIAGRPEHEWFVKGFDPKRVEEIKQYYQKRYNEQVQ